MRRIQGDAFAQQRDRLVRTPGTGRNFLREENRAVLVGDIEARIEIGGYIEQRS